MLFICNVYTAEEELPLNVVKTGYVATGKWRYYHIALPDPTPQLVILMNQTGTRGDCDLYVRREALPDFFNWYISSFFLSFFENNVCLSITQ
jgi:hypothetical protein